MEEAELRYLLATPLIRSITVTEAHACCPLAGSLILDRMAGLYENRVSFFRMPSYMIGDAG